MTVHSLTSQQPRTALDEMNKNGEFKRKDAAWRNWISQDEGSEFPPEAGRYHLYVAYACPWAHRTMLLRALKGLDHVLSITVVHPTWRRTRPDKDHDMHTGWVFGSHTENTAHQSVLTNAIGLGGLLYLAASVLLGAAFLWFAIRVYRVRQGREADQAAKALFGFSLLYLFALFAVLLVEHTVTRVMA